MCLVSPLRRHNIPCADEQMNSTDQHFTSANYFADAWAYAASSVKGGSKFYKRCDLSGLRNLYLHVYAYMYTFVRICTRM